MRPDDSLAQVPGVFDVNHLGNCSAKDAGRIVRMHTAPHGVRTLSAQLHALPGFAVPVPLYGLEVEGATAILRSVQLKEDRLAPSLLVGVQEAVYEFEQALLESDFFRADPGFWKRIDKAHRSALRLFDDLAQLRSMERLAVERHSYLGEREIANLQTALVRLVIPQHLPEAEREAAGKAIWSGDRDIRSALLKDWRRIPQVASSIEVADEHPADESPYATLFPVAHRPSRAAEHDLIKRLCRVYIECVGNPTYRKPDEATQGTTSFERFLGAVIKTAKLSLENSLDHMAPLAIRDVKEEQEHFRTLETHSSHS